MATGAAIAAEAIGAAVLGAEATVILTTAGSGGEPPIGSATNPAQTANIQRFESKIPANAKGSIETHKLPNDGVAVQATSPGEVPGSKAVYEKQIDADGNTVQMTKTTYDPNGEIVHVKDKLNNQTLP